MNVRESIEITYAAHTNSCTFFLDAEGFCRRVVMNPALKRTAKGRDAEGAATRCIGAQYVASLDASVPGMLAEMPRVGISMIFATVDHGGRVSLVRTGVVTRFDHRRLDDPFASGSTSTSVQTSAPVLPPSPPGPPRRREASVRQRPKESAPLPRAVLRVPEAAPPRGVTPPPRPARAARSYEDERNLAKTAEYEAETHRRSLRAGVPLDTSSIPTLRRVPVRRSGER